MSEEVLDLSTIVERRTVRITSKLHRGGKLYEILGEQELSIWHLAQIEAKAVELQGFDLGAVPTPAKQRAYRKALRDIVAVIAPSIEEKVLGELSDTHLLSIFAVFRGAEPRGGESGNASSAQTSGASSLGSNGSTAVTRKRGTTSRSGS